MITYDPRQIGDGPVICGVCGTPFEAPDDSDQSVSDSEHSGRAARSTSRGFWYKCPRYDAVLFDLLTALLDSWTLWAAVAGEIRAPRAGGTSSTLP
jgi:hypothetical protein